MILIQRQETAAPINVRSSQTPIVQDKELIHVLSAETLLKVGLRHVTMEI